MPWKEVKMETMREEFVTRALAHEKSKSALCREYNISRPTGDKWIERYLSGEPCSDRSRVPRTSPSQVDAETEKMIVKYRQQYPALGAAKIKRMLENEGMTGLPCSRTFHNIFRRNGLITQEASMAATPYIRFEREASNQLWQADFKGHFSLLDNTRCHPLNVIDDCARFNLCIEALENETMQAVKPVFSRLFREYGLPESLLCDNGNPWGTPQSTGYTKFEVWLMELGILTIHGRPLHPQTQGKEERFNRTFTRECLKGASFSNRADAQESFNRYRQFYNEKRPHYALGMDTPAMHYKPSQRRMPEKIEAWEYEPEYTLCKVKKTGYFNYKGQEYFLSEGFGGKIIGVRESHLPNQVTLVFREFRIGRINLSNRVYTLKRAERLTPLPGEWSEK